MQGKYSVELRQRILRASQFQLGQSQHSQQVQVLAVEADAAPADLGGLVELRRLEQQGRIILDELNIGRAYRERPRHQLFGLLEASLGGLDKAEKVQRVEVVGFVLDDLPIQSRRLGELALPVKSVGLLQPEPVLMSRHISEAS